MIFKLTSLLLKVRDRSKCESAETCSPGNINNFLGAGHEQSKTAKVLASGLETFEVSEINDYIVSVLIVIDQGIFHMEDDGLRFTHTW